MGLGVSHTSCWREETSKNAHWFLAYMSFKVNESNVCGWFMAHKRR